METVGSKLKLKGFFQGAELGEDGQAGALGSYISLTKEDTGEVLNVVISDGEMSRVLAFTYQPADPQTESPSEEAGEIAADPESAAEVLEEEPQEETSAPAPFPV